MVTVIIVAIIEALKRGWPHFFGQAKVAVITAIILGLVCDTWGTTLMIEYVGGITFEIHQVTGVIAIVLMLVHALWALIVLVKKDETAIRNFHKFSLAVWVIWLIPYFSPMFLQMAK